MRTDPTGHAPSPTAPPPAAVSTPRINRAVVAIAPGDRAKCLMYWAGPAIFAFTRREREDIYALGLSDGPPGVSVWEGAYEWTDEHEIHPVGAFRRPTEAEWAAICEGRHPWPEEVRCLGCDADPAAPPVQHDRSCPVVGDAPDL